MQHYYQFLEQLNLNNTNELKTYLIENSSKLSTVNSTPITSLSVATISAELFIFFLTDLELKNFKYWDLSKVNFKQIKQDFFSKKKQNAIDFDLFKELDLSYSNLTGVDLSDLDFSESNFMGAKLNKAKLNSTDFTAADFSHADLSHADLSFTELNESAFINTRLTDAKLINCHARKANFANANMQRCRLDKADVCEANFSDADLAHANLVASNAQDVNFSRAILKFSSLNYVNFARSNFRGANLDNANLIGSNVTAINLEGTSTNAVSISYDYSSFATWSDLKALSQQKYYPERYLNPQQSTQNNSTGLALLDRCLSSTKPPANDCKISWADIDSFSNGHYTCDVNQIVNNARAFLWYFRSKDESTQTQWLNVADVIKFSNNTESTIKSLIHFQKLSPLLTTAMQALEIKSNELKKSVHVDKAPTLSKFSKLEWMNYFKELEIDPVSIALNSSIFNVNTISLQKIDTGNNTTSYNINFDFLSKEIRELLENISAISITKWPSSTEFIVNPQLKTDAVFSPQQISWLAGILNITQYTALLQEFPDNFSPCVNSCLNVILSGKDVIRHALLQLVNPVSFAKPIESFTQNLTSILPYQHSLQFTDNIEMMLDNQAKQYAYATRNESIANLIQSYSALARRLKIYFIITHPISKDILSIGHQNQQILQNHPEHRSHLVSNGDGKQFVITSGRTKLTINDLPLAEVTLYANSNDKNPYSELNSRSLAQQIKEEFNTTLAIDLAKQGNDILLKYSLNLAYAENDILPVKVPVISVRLKDARIDRWYNNLFIIPNVASTRLTLQGLTMQLTPLPLQLEVNNGSTDFINIDSLEENTAIFISREIENYSFFHSQGDLVLTNAWTPHLEINQLCNIVLQNFNLAPEKGLTLALEFINKKILLAEHLNKIVNAQSWNETLQLYKQDLFSNAYQLGQRPSLSVIREDCYHPPLINLRRLELYPDDYYYQGDEADYSSSRERRSIPDSSVPSMASNSANAAPLGLLQNSLNNIKQGSKWLSDKLFSSAVTQPSYTKLSAIDDENIWETAYQFQESYDRSQQKHEKSRFVPHNKPSTPTPHISGTSHQQKNFSTTPHCLVQLNTNKKSLEKNIGYCQAKSKQAFSSKPSIKQLATASCVNNQTDFFKTKPSKSKKLGKSEKFSTAHFDKLVTTSLILTQCIVHTPKISVQPQLHNQAQCFSSPPLAIGMAR